VTELGEVNRRDPQNTSLILTVSTIDLTADVFQLVTSGWKIRPVNLNVSENTGNDKSLGQMEIQVSDLQHEGMTYLSWMLLWTHPTCSDLALLQDRNFLPGYYRKRNPNFSATRHPKHSWDHIADTPGHCIEGPHLGQPKLLHGVLFCF
jgi:hypothetical protein